LQRADLRLRVAHLRLQRGDLFVEHAPPCRKEGALAKPELRSGRRLRHVRGIADVDRECGLGRRPCPADLLAMELVLHELQCSVVAHVADHEQRLAGPYLLTVADEDLAHDAAFLVLHGLPIELDLELRRRNHRTRREPHQMMSSAPTTSGTSACRARRSARWTESSRSPYRNKSANESARRPLAGAHSRACR
jgi:hypothetical protein